MSMNLVLAPVDNTSIDNWAAIRKASGNDYAMVFIDDETVNEIGCLISGVTLANGEPIESYGCCTGQDYAIAIASELPNSAYIQSFGPSLMPRQVQDQIRILLANGENGADAVRLFDEVIRLELKIGFQGKLGCPAMIQGVNQTSDEIEFNLSNGYMVAMIKTLGLGDAVDAKYGSGEVSFERFVAAVNDNGKYTDMQHRLDAFVECGRRHGTTGVYWGR